MGHISSQNPERKYSSRSVANSQSSKYNNHFKNHASGGESSRQNWNGGVLLGGLTLAGYLAWRKSQANQVFGKVFTNTYHRHDKHALIFFAISKHAAATVSPSESEKVDKNLPTYKSSEVAAHYEPKTRVHLH